MASSSAILHVVEREVVVFRRLWRGWVFSLFLNPVLYLAAMGIGLGNLVDQHSGTVEGLTYLEFVAPGMLVAVATQVAAGEGMWPVLGGVKWIGNFHGTVATAVTADEVLYGYVLWVALRTMVGAVPFLLRRGVARRDPVGVGRARDPGGRPVRGGVLRAARRVLGHARQRPVVPADHAHRRAAAVPVLGHLLPDLAAPGRAAADRAAVAAVPRGRARPGRDHGHVRSRVPISRTSRCSSPASSPDSRGAGAASSEG